MGRFKQALLAGLAGTGEGPALIAEQLAFHQVFRDGGAVDRHEGAVGPLALVVNGLSEELLARTGFPVQEDVAVHLGKAPGLVDRGADRRAVSLDVFKAVAGVMAAGALTLADSAFRVGDGVGRLEGHQHAQAFSVLLHRDAV